MLYDALGLNGTKKNCITFVGAGGKTTNMFQLATELKHKGFCVIVTTTTKIYNPGKGQYDGIFLTRRKEELNASIRELARPGIYIVAQGITEENKLLGIRPEWVGLILDCTGIDYVLVEGDGSRGLPIKAPASFEPVIPADTSHVVGVLGLDCIGQAASLKTVHRLSEFSKVTGCIEGNIITSEHLIHLILHPSGLFKNAPVGSERCVLLNKADDDERISNAHEMKKNLIASGLRMIITGYSGSVLKRIDYEEGFKR